MSIHEPAVPARRGRRDPELEAILDAEEGGPDFENEAADVFVDGDRLTCKVTLQHPTEVGDGWFTFGRSTSVAPGSDVEEVAAGLREAVAMETYLLIDQITGQVAEAVQEQQEVQRASKRSNRIQPKQN